MHGTLEFAIAGLEQPPLFEAKGVDAPKERRIDVRLGQAELYFDGVGQLLISVWILAAHARAYRTSPLDLLALHWAGNLRDLDRRGPLEVAS